MGLLSSEKKLFLLMKKIVVSFCLLAQRRDRWKPATEKEFKMVGKLIEKAYNNFAWCECM